MTLLYYDPVFLEHVTGNHPERAERIQPAVRHLAATGMDAMCERPAWSPATLAELSLVHSPVYVESVHQFAAAGGGLIEADTVVSPRSDDVARLAVGAVCDAVRRVVAGEHRRAFCLVRPPGHHALPAGSMGFCLYNNVAIAARMATQQLDVDRVLIVDWDVHHGNGTQDMFWEDPRVAFFSIHRWPFYPGTGAADEQGAGGARGSTVNVPIEFGTSPATYLDEFRRALERLASKIKPDLVIISAGFDAHRDDPIGSLGLSSEHFITLTRAVLDVAEVHARGRVVSALEGGYNPDAVSECVAYHLEELAEA